MSDDQLATILEKLDGLAERLRRMELDRPGSDLAMLTVRDVAAVTTLSEREVWRRAKEGKFPKPRQMGDKRRAWTKTSVAKWLREQPTAG